MGLRIIVLGSAAGGGFPQWNCGCANCSAVRQQRPGYRVRTQDSLAVSADGRSWWLLNASPDLLAQIQATPELWPRDVRHSPIAGVVLTNGDLDHTLGLLLLRESQRLVVYATARVIEGLRKNIALKTLERFREQTRWHALELRRPVELSGPGGEPSGVSLLPRPAAGKPPLHLAGAFEPSEEDNVALQVSAREGGSLVYASALAQVDADAVTALEAASACFLDGTFWSEEELPSLGVAAGPARTMAHLPISGPDGSLQKLSRITRARRFYTHVNNTNPILNEASPEHARVREAGWEVATDGLRLEL